MLRRLGVLACVALLAAAACSSKKHGSTPPAKTPATPTAASASPSPAASGPAGTPSPSSPSASPTARLVPPPAGSLAESISFVSINEAWVLAKAGTITAVLHTTDRGTHWSEVGTIPAAIGSVTGDIHKIRFANPSDGWAFDPALYATTNGGATWHAVTMPGQVSGLEASNGTAWAVVDPCNGAASCTAPSTLQKASAGSDSWTAVSGVSLPSMSIASAEIAPRGQSVYVLDGTSFIHSAGGTSFAPLAVPCLAGFGISAFAASTASDLGVLCSGDAGAGSSTKDVFVSTNSGASYTQIAQAPRGGQASAMAAGSPTTFAIAAASGASWIYVTSGPDTNWSQPLDFGDGGAGWADLGFTDATHGVVIHGPSPVGPGVVYLTDNGGASWFTVTLSA